MKNVITRARAEKESLEPPERLRERETKPVGSRDQANPNFDSNVYQSISDLLRWWRKDEKRTLHLTARLDQSLLFMVIDA